ncbi:TPA: bifunctional ADP-dependent NAD(P)H-hydrate dehydratase/NAD(P)H-hydrate epimerase [Candidatus Sumerlaeota bacterium]|nr:bifunctional ADP-dependent NAD(P)H-hydrate dehydratase/NAD(P)H-hydrate epimerase [Candidatus Sumerlaeota bacterium]
MSLKLVTNEEMRAIDKITIQERGVPNLDLMERAGQAVTKTVVSHYMPQAVAIVCGKGNNAGDGLVAARLLSNEGIEVRVLLLTEGYNLSEAGRANFERLPASVQQIDRQQVPKMPELFAGCDVIIDAILGTGTEGPVRGTCGEAIAIMNSLDIPIVAIDIPSGLNADTGLIDGPCIIADTTVTIGLPKRGLVLGEGSQYAGHLVVADIGFPEDLMRNPEIKLHLLDKSDVAAALPPRSFAAHKGTFGALLVIAGQDGMSGAAYLTSASALRSGCGMVYGAFPAEVAHALAPVLMEAVKIPLPGASGKYLTQESWDRLAPHLEKCDALALGPGIGTHHETSRLVDELVCQDIPMIIDADALNCLGTRAVCLAKRNSPIVMTPHPGEMARMIDAPVAEVQADRIGIASKFAVDAGVVLVLKGAQTVIAAPDGRVFINPTGNTGLAKGGSGDLLTGLIGGLLAQGCTGLDAACAGVYLHGFCADIASRELSERSMLATDLLHYISEAFLEVERDNEK